MELPSEDCTQSHPPSSPEPLPLSPTVADDEESSSLSKNKLRKLRRYEQSLAHKKLKRAKERETKKLRGLSNGKGNDEKLAEIEKLKNALKVGSKVVIDCQFHSRMSKKELTRFAQQLRRLYSSNRSSETPLHLHLASLPKESELFSVCCQQNDGFANYILDISDKSVLELFGSDNVVYLTPDATDAISLDKGFEKDKVYVIGGYVDETTTKDLTHGFATSAKITCVRLPIEEFFEASAKGTFKKVLTVNQVVDIILEWHRTNDWVASILKGLPARTGFTPKSQAGGL